MISKKQCKIALQSRAAKRLILATTIILSNTVVSLAQVDTVVINNQKIACLVKEVTPEAVRYTYPGEDVVNAAYKNTVQKIIFKSGRVQTFAESTSYKSISDVMDFENVSITTLENEVKGLYKISDVSSKAKGTTVFSSQERVKDRAYRKMKLQAAMFGANVILLTNQRSEGNKYGGYWQSSSTTETNLTGIAYSNSLPDFEKFKILIGDNKSFVATKRYELGASFSDVEQENVDKPFTVTSVVSENGLIMVEGNLKGENNVQKFQLANYKSDSFNIAYRYKGTCYNYLIKI